MAFQILSVENKTSKKYKLVRRSVCFKLGDIPYTVTDPKAWVKDSIRQIVSHIISEVRPYDRIGFVVSSEGFKRGNANIPFKRADTVTFSDIWQVLGKIYQSNAAGFASDTLRITMTQAKANR